MNYQCKRAKQMGIPLAILATVVGMAVASKSSRADLVEDWGDNSYGELAIGGITSSNTPVAVSILGNGVTGVAVGGFHSLAIQNGSVYSWGYNGYGELGNGNTVNSSTPIAVSILSKGVTAIAAGYFHSLAIKNGGVYAWGTGTYGDLGTGSSATVNSIPFAVPTLSSGVTAIAAGYGDSLAIQNGQVFAWGRNDRGQLGNGSKVNSNTPVAITKLTSGVTAIAAGDEHNLAIQNGALYSWGANSLGALGNGNTTDNNTPNPVNGLSNGVTAIAAGYGFSLAVQNGGVYAWGYNAKGALGNGTTDNSTLPVQIDPVDLTNITSVAASVFSSYALSADGSLWVWGDNTYGELGLGTSTDEYWVPQHLLPPTGYIFTSIDADADSYEAIATLAATPEPGSLAFLGSASLLLIKRRKWRA